jgi:hypothetical protein
MTRVAAMDLGVSEFVVKTADNRDLLSRCAHPSPQRGME